MRQIRAMPCPRCYVCGNEGQIIIVGTSDILFGAPGSWSFRKCCSRDCGLVWLDPMPIPQDLAIAYERYYTHGEPDRAGLYKLSKAVFGFATDALLLPFGIPLQRRRSELMFLHRARPGKLLDVGCGDGRFLARMAKRGWTVWGIDLDPAAAKIARDKRGLNVETASVEDLVAQGAKFDVITASHVIEHVADPLSFLDACRRLLYEGGKLVLKTPNVKSYGATKYGRAWRGLEPPRHLRLFSVAALNRCALKAGFASGVYFTSAAGAGDVLAASHFIAKNKSLHSQDLPLITLLQSRALRVLMSLKAQLIWLFNRNSGEEICAVIARGSGQAPAAGEL